MSHVPYRNQLLGLLASAELAVLQPHLVPVQLMTGMVLEHANAAVIDVYFIEDGIVSIIASMLPEREIEVGVVGRDGCVGGSVLLDDAMAVHTALIQIDGAAHRVPVAVLLALARQSPGLRAVLLRYLRAFSIQVASTALANGHASLEARLARWLLMCADRLDTETLTLTHDLLSLMIGVRRSGVTMALQVLEGLHAIRATRGRIVILDRALLEKHAGGSYGFPEAEYRRLLGASVASH